MIYILDFQMASGIARFAEGVGASIKVDELLSIISAVLIFKFMDLV